MRLTAIANGEETAFDPQLNEAIDAYEACDLARVETWNRTFEAHGNVQP